MHLASTSTRGSWTNRRKFALGATAGGEKHLSNCALASELTSFRTESGNYEATPRSDVQPVSLPPVDLASQLNREEHHPVLVQLVPIHGQRFPRSTSIR